MGLVTKVLTSLHTLLISRLCISHYAKLFISHLWKLDRNSLEYEKGASEFVSSSSKRLGDPDEMFCPCVDCRNVCHQSSEKVFEHLVIRGMDEKYKSCKFWSKHG